MFKVSPLSTVQIKCIYTIFKAENQETQFTLLCTKPSIDKHKFSSFQEWQSQGSFISNLCLAFILFVRFIGQTWRNSRIERADLLAIHAKQKSFQADISTKHSQRVKKFQGIRNSGASQPLTIIFDSKNFTPFSTFYRQSGT